jgi:hypothetical protein
MQVLCVFSLVIFMIIIIMDRGQQGAQGALNAAV